MEQYVYRFPPCPTYDVEGMESWLEAMAQKGLTLSSDGFFVGFAIFEKTSPKPIRYRLQPMTGKGASDAAIELAERYGWRFIASRGEFAIYAAEDPSARELNTDPTVQAMAMAAHYRRRRNNFLFNLLLLLLYGALFLWIGPMYYLTETRWWFLLSVPVLLAAYLFAQWAELRQLRSLRQKLALGESLDRRSNWRGRRWKHFLRSTLYIAVLICFYGSLLQNQFFDWEDSRWQPRTSYDEPLPFATLEALAPEGTFFVSDTWLNQPDHLAVRSTPLTPTQINLQQYGELRSGSDVLFDGGMDVRYYETANEWLAKQLYQDLLRNDRRTYKKYHTLLELPALDCDQSAAYTTYRPTLLLRKENRVLRVTLNQYGEEANIPLETWAQVFSSEFT